MGKRKQFVWTVEVEIAEVWVADGFDLTADRMQEIILNGALRYASGAEVRCKVLTAPSPADVREAQGYPREASHG